MNNKYELQGDHILVDGKEVNAEVLLGHILELQQQLMDYLEQHV